MDQENPATNDCIVCTMMLNQIFAIDNHKFHISRAIKSCWDGAVIFCLVLQIGNQIICHLSVNIDAREMISSLIFFKRSLLVLIACLYMASRRILCEKKFRLVGKEDSDWNIGLSRFIRQLQKYSTSTFCTSNPLRHGTVLFSFVVDVQR